MIHQPEPRSKIEKRILHLVLGVLNATHDERRLAFLKYQYRGYADALHYIEEIKMVDTETAQKWLPKSSDTGLKALWVEPARFDDAGNVLAYRCQKCDGGGSTTMAREVLEAYYERDSDEPQEAAA